MMALLTLRRVSKAFGGLVANKEVTLDVAEGEIVGIIGPNGAGKSTLFDVITGYSSADAGDIRLRGADLRGLTPDAIARRGIGRTFQKLKPFASLTVLENTMVGALLRTNDVREARARAMEQIQWVGLADRASVYAGALSTGQRKRLEMARAMATDPRLLLLDEVTGGVDQRSIPGLVELIGRLRDRGVALMVIEHNMRVVMSVSDRIIALHLGEIVAEGTPTEVARDRRVIDAYLGEAYA